MKSWSNPLAPVNVEKMMRKPWEETWHVRQDGMNKDRGIASVVAA